MATIHELKPKTSPKTKKREKAKIEDLPGYKMHMESLVKKNISYQETATTISEDGEILEQNFKTISKTKEDDFIKLYLSDIGHFHKLERNQQDLLYYFLKIMSYDNLIIINKRIKERIAEESGKAYSTVENALVSYVKSGILLRDGRGVYIANPYLFGRGRFEDIQKIRTEIIYTSEGIKLKSQIEKNEEQ
jgi:Firmicute plasmid replication protein (RepL)